MSKLLSPSFLFMDNIFYKKLKLTPSLGVVEAPYIGWAAYMHIVEYMQQDFFHLLIVLNDFCTPKWSFSAHNGWCGFEAHTSLITLFNWMDLCKLPYAAVCVWQGEFCRQPFPHAVLPLCRHSRYSSLSWIFWGERVLLDLRFVHTPSL